MVTVAVLQFDYRVLSGPELFFFFLSVFVDVYPPKYQLCIQDYIPLLL